MWTDLPPEQLAATPVGELATIAPPRRWHGTLRQLGTHCRGDAWVVSGLAEVAQALAAPALGVVPPVPVGRDGPAARLVARMARFSDGPEHRRRRELLTGLLQPAAEVARAAGACANDYLRRRLAAFDVLTLARTLPAEVLARALGLAAAQASRASVLTGKLCDAVTGPLPPGEETGRAADDAAAELVALMADLGHREHEWAAAAISILFQARDATAALIGSAVLSGQRSLTPAQRVEYVLRHDAPVQCTRRVAMADVRVGEVLVAAGAAVWIFVAAAERGAGMPATFGYGVHACPGAAHAAAIARQVVTVLDAEGWRLAAGQRIEYEPRPNIRMPVRVVVTRP